MGVVLVILLMAGLVPLVPSATADTVIGAEEVGLMEAGDFSEPESWQISSTAGFSSDPAEHSEGMVADGELSLTHNRPDNFQQTISWATYSVTNSNATLGEPDSYYTWSKGPNITMSGYDFSGLHGMQLANVSLVLHFSIPDVLNQDSVRVILQNHGSDKLVVTYARTFGPIYRMTNPMVLSLDGLALTDWTSLEGTQFTIDYVSTGTSDDSEVRVDAVGLRVKYHQPWYSFETVKAINTVTDVDSPVLDIGPFDGTITGLSQESCGLAPDGPAVGEWAFDVEVPPLQQLGRIHVFGTGNHTSGYCWMTQTAITRRLSQGMLWQAPSRRSTSGLRLRTGAYRAPASTSTTRIWWPMGTSRARSKGWQRPVTSESQWAAALWPVYQSNTVPSRSMSQWGTLCPRGEGR